MKLRLDLHTHSAASHDGRMTMEEMVCAARAAGLQGFAVCDHNHVFSRRVSAEDMLIIPAAEFSTAYGHLLALFVTQPIEKRDFPALVEAIHAQGGVAVLAHPFQHSRDAARIAPIAPLLDGVEVWNGRAERKNPQANAMAADFAHTHALRRFAGSDAHLAREIGAGYVELDVAEATLDAVKAALLENNVRIFGRRSRAIDTARSQWTRLRKQNAPLKSYIKWALFAAKCCALDVVRGESHVTAR